MLNRHQYILINNLPYLQCAVDRMISKRWKWTDNPKLESAKTPIIPTTRARASWCNRLVELSTLFIEDQTHTNQTTFLGINGINWNIVYISKNKNKDKNIASYNI